jgi:hypothetical protein
MGKQTPDKLKKAPDINGNSNSNVELTIYSQNLALVKEKREINLKTGIQSVEYTNVATEIDPTSIIVETLEDENTVILEQNYEYDLESNSKLLDKYLGREIIVTDKEGFAHTGKLLSHDSGIVLHRKDKNIVSLPEISKIEFSDIETVFTKPTLIWKIDSLNSGKQDFLISYLTSGISWKAEYVVKINEDNTKADVKSWVIIDNKAGTNFENAKIQLVAGEIHRVYTPQPKAMYLRGVAEKLTPASADSFIEEGLFEYHLYSLERPTTLKNNQGKQISFISANNVLIEKELVFDIWKGEKIQVILKTENSKKKGLGLPLPGGLVRIYKADSEESLQFLGEDQIEHIPEEGIIKITVGNAFDIKGKRIQTNYEKISDTLERLTYEITINNSKPEVQNLTVIEHLSGDWKIIENSDPYEKIDAFTVEFKVSIAASGVKTITYTVENKLQPPVR